jgi:ankyrin repeat protein
MIYLILGPLKLDYIGNDVVIALINEAKDWDIDIKYKCAFFMHYFNLTDLLLLCDCERIVPKDKDGHFHLSYFPHVQSLSEPDPIQCLQLLLKLGVRDKSSVNALMSPNSDGETVLTYAIKNCDVKLVECLVETTMGIPMLVMINKEPLLIAIQMLEQSQTQYLDMIRIIQLLIASDFSFPTYDDFKTTLLFENLLHDITVDNIAKVKLRKQIEKFIPLILEDRAIAIIENCIKCDVFNIDAKDELGNAAIHKSCMNGDIDTLKLLIESKADINIKNNYGDTPLHAAVEADNIEIVTLLLRQKENFVNLKNNHWILTN